MSRNYKFHNLEGIYFVSFATVYWVDVFVREKYMAIFVDGLAYCQVNKGLELFGYCVMPSHVHMIFRSSDVDPSGILRDLKRFTGRKIIAAIANNPQESRREWIVY